MKVNMSKEAELSRGKWEEAEGSRGSRWTQVAGDPSSRRKGSDSESAPLTSSSI